MTDQSPTFARKPLSRAALTGILFAIVGIALFAASAIGYRTGRWHFLEALDVARWGTYAAALGLLLSVLGAILSRPEASRRGFVLSLLGLVLSLPIVAMAAWFDYAARIYPPINDISTDLEDPPIFWDMPNPTDYPGGPTADEQRAAYPDLAPLTLPLPSEEVYRLALKIVKARNWDVVAAEPDDGRIEAVATSLIYGFKDEVIIRIQEDGAGSLIDIRSRSRLGRIDRGVNARRIRALLQYLKEGAQG